MILNTPMVSADIADGLVAYYPFDGNANDMSGNGHGGTVIGATHTADRFGVSNGALNFDGLNDYVDIPYHQDIEPSNFTISLWINTLQATQGSIINSDPNGDSCLHGYNLEVRDTAIIFNVDPSSACGNWNSASSLHGINDGTWHHIVASYGPIPQLYIDGEFVKSGFQLGYQKTHASIRIGMRRTSSGPIYFFNGKIDDIRIHNRVLSENEIKSLFNETQSCDLIGDSLNICSIHELILEQYTQKEFTVQLMNSEDAPQSATLEVINPHSGLTVSPQSSDPITIAPGETVNVPLLIDATSMGVYDGILLEVTVDDGSTLYSNLTVFVTEPGSGDLPDLTVSSNDISIVTADPDQLTYVAAIHNRGDSSVPAVTVQFYDFGVLAGETVVTDVPANGSTTASITVPAPPSGDRLVDTVIDP
jgi:hypothetical protein